MEEKIAFLDYTENNASYPYPNWNTWYYLDDNDYPRAVTYKIVPMKDIECVSAGDGFLDIKTKDGGLTCFGSMMPAETFSATHKRTDRETQRRQKWLENHYKRTKDYEETAFGISSRFEENLSSFIWEEYRKWELEQYILLQLNSIKQELVIFGTAFRFNEEGKHRPMSCKEISELKPSVSCSIDNYGEVTASLNDDAKTLLELVSVDINTILD